MSRKAIRVAPGEMELLGMLWAEGPLTIRGAHERFPSYGNTVSYPTMQTRLNRLVEKGLAARSDDRPAEYRATVTRDQVSVGHLRELVAKIGRGDVVPFVARLLGEQTLSPEQLDQLQDLLAQARQRSETEERAGANTKGTAKQRRKP